MNNSALTLSLTIMVQEIERLIIGTDLKEYLEIRLNREEYYYYKERNGGTEHRFYGKLWNEKRCYEGRGIILRNGSKQRLYGVIAKFNIIPIGKIRDNERFVKRYGTEHEPDRLIAAIKIELAGIV